MQVAAVSRECCVARRLRVSAICLLCLLSWGGDPFFVLCVCKHLDMVKRHCACTSHTCKGQGGVGRGSWSTQTPLPSFVSHHSLCPVQQGRARTPRWRSRCLARVLGPNAFHLMSCLQIFACAPAKQRERERERERPRPKREGQHSRQTLDVRALGAASLRGGYACGREREREREREMQQDLGVLLTLFQSAQRRIAEEGGLQEEEPWT